MFVKHDVANISCRYWKLI